jgi:hypothetical protein
MCKLKLSRFIGSPLFADVIFGRGFGLLLMIGVGVIYIQPHTTLEE